MATVDELSVRVSANVATFKQGINSAAESVDDLSGDALDAAASLEILSGRANDAEGETRELGRASTMTAARVSALGGAATSTAASLTGMNAAANAATFSFSSLANTPLLFALPVLTAGATALLSVLFPLAAAAGTVAAALGGIGFVAFAGTAAAAATHTETLKDTLTTVKEQLLEVLEPLADLFLPMLESLLLQLPDVVEETLALTGGLEQFRDSIWLAARAFLDVVPEMLATMIEFGEMALPIIRRFFQRLEGGVRPAMMGMLDVTREIAPALMRFGRAFVDAIPELTRLGAVVLNTLVPAFTDFIGLIEDVMQVGAESGGLVDFLGTLVNRAATWVAGPGMAMLSNLANTVFDALLDVFQPDARGGSSPASRGIDALISFLGGTLSTLATGISNGRLGTEITAVISAVMGSIETALSDVSAGDVQGGVSNLTRIIGGVFDSVMQGLTTPEARGGATAIGRIVGELMAAFAQELIGYVRSDAFQSDLALFADALRTALGESIEGMTIPLNNATVNVAGQEIPLGGFSNISPFGFAGSGNLARRMDVRDVPVVETALQPSSMGGRRITPTEAQAIADAMEGVTLNAEGRLTTENGEIQAEIRSLAAEQVDQEQRQTRERQGRNTNFR
jgi:hypothetical protein